ncbi:bifunctional 2',3'-cyclic-nucleotide 2'-phosphodiesterase/3'-nucleotidase [Streptococcus caprae]|uniref:Bifunctional 2',3'-cyclic-nucleotide 2'-phosphodiesterase/3'-nucleotidase n=1 Tax=Streptococcus caprae TaxID=1640501 RepID=A0ABV8CTU6_9STRE
MSKRRFMSQSALLLSLALASGVVVQADETSTAPAESTASAIANTETSTAETGTEANSSSSDLSDEVTEPVAEATNTDNTTDSEGIATPDVAPTSATTATAEPAAASSSEESKDIAPVEGQTVDVRIISTTDLHTNLVNYDYYQDKPSQSVGLAKTAVLIDQAKAENPNVILMDNGDTIQGTPLGTYKAIVDKPEAGEQHPMYAALESLGYDVGTLGNHEFNYGLDYLDQVISTAGMPIVNANVLDATTLKPLYKTYEIITKTFTDTTGKPVTLKLGVTGIVPPQILNWDKANLEGKVVVKDSVEALEALVPEIRAAGADLVFVLSHSGIGDDVYEKGEENEGYQIAGIEGVDAVVTGHSHAEFPAGGKGFYSRYAGVDDVNGLINGTPVTMAGKYGDHLGIIDLNITYKNGKWQTNSAKGEIRKIDTKSDIVDESIIAIAKEAHEGTVNYVRQQVGTTTAPINSYFALVKDDPSVQIVNNAQIWYAKQELAGTPEASLPILSAAAPFKAGGRDFNDVTSYTDIPAGPIAIKNVADLYLYDNVTAILKLTGADIREWLEMSAGQFNQIDPTSTAPQNIVNSDYRIYNFDVIDGVTYEYDITQPNKYDRSGKLVNPDASRVRNLSYQGQPIDDKQEFIVVTNNYRANGSFPGVVNASLNRLLNLENRQAIINYIISEKTINPSADNNWNFTNSIAGLDLRFYSADSAKALIAGAEDMVYLAPADGHDGFGEYRFIYTEKKVVVTPDQPAPSPTLTDKDRQEIRDIVRKAYQETQQVPLKQAGQSKASVIPTSTKELPSTGSTDSSWMTLLGLNLLAVTGLFGRKSRKH